MNTYTKRTKKQERLMVGGDNPFHPRFITVCDTTGTDVVVWFKWNNRGPLIINDWRIYIVQHGETVLVNINEWIGTFMD